MVHYQNSYIFGKQQEEKVLPIINEYFKKTISPYPQRYSKYDFFDEDGTNYELKSRQNKMASYPDTMITLNKMSTDSTLILLFNFTDCLSYIAFEPSLFKTFKTSFFSRAGIAADEKEHIFIPIGMLTVIKYYV